jgi:hypothetical protein
LRELKGSGNLHKETTVDEDTERKARKIRLKILRLQKELAATQKYARLGSFLHADRPGTIRSQAERDRKRLEEAIAEARDELEALTTSEDVPPKKKQKAETPKAKAAARKAPTKKKRDTKKEPTKKKAAKRPKSAKKPRQSK